jgi:hypothetical protein
MRPGRSRCLGYAGGDGEGLTAIARRMGVSYSAVSRRVTAVAQRLREDPQFRTRVERVIDVKLKT